MDTSLPASRPPLAILKAPVAEVSIIIPARNEEANLGSCLRSLTPQTGVAFEIIVVDDGSTDRTREIANSFAQVKVIAPEPLPSGWTGKNNALITGARQARASWLLFTDADTVHTPGSLARALTESQDHQADLLSYSPEQLVVTFSERAVMPAVFAELAAKFPPHKVRNQDSGITAANGQYILVRRAAYDAVGGHAAVATEILDDVALARLFRHAGFNIHFRYAADAVRTRMYRNWSQLREGWTKNLALLFPHPERLAARTLFLWILAWSSFMIAASGARRGHFLRIGFAFVWLWVYRRIRVANFASLNNLFAMTCGLPIFAYLLLRSKKAHEHRKVSWKGRDYEVAAPAAALSDPSEAAQHCARIENRTLRSEN